MKNIFLILSITLVLILSPKLVQSQVMIDETVADTNTVITGLDIPWEILYGPDGWLWVTERFGRVSRVHPETGQQNIILDHSDFVIQQGESGMLGMALHPEFPDDPRVYIVYTYWQNGIKEKLVHFTWDGQELVDETILIAGIQGNSTHDGSRLIFAPDGKLFMTTGDAQNLSAPQNPDHLSGKILRLNDDGTIPDDNPFPDNYVYSWGHRNAQGLYFGPDGTLYSSEHGPSTDDEINIVEAGRNYGWPEVTGFCNTPDEISFCNENNVKEPMIAWTPTIAPSDIIFYEDEMFPEWTGSILLTVLKNKRIIELELSDDGQEITGENHYFINYWGRLRDICAGPDGEIYLATSGDSWSNTNPFTHSIIRLKAEESTSFNNSGHSDNITITSGHKNIRINADASWLDSGWYIFDIQGRLIQKGTISATEMVIGVNFEPGIYIVKIMAAGEYSTVKKIAIR
jgi:glucose/arabinose dehydrogenase